MEVIIDSSVVFDSLEYLDCFSNKEKKEDRIALEKIIELKKDNRISCIRTINAEFEIAKDTKQKEIDQKWGQFIIRDMGIGLKASLKQKCYDPKWDHRFGELKGNGFHRHIDISMFVQAEYLSIQYIISTDYNFINWSKGKSKIVEVIRPVDFIKIKS